MKKNKKGSKRLLRAWATYDWANSVYTAVITTTIFPIYYGTLLDDSDTILVLGQQIRSTAMISFIVGLTISLVVLLSPILSGIADYIGNKKIFMRFFVYLGAFSCIGLYWFNLDTIYLGLVFYALGIVGFQGSLVFYNSYLPDIAHQNQMDKASAMGFSYGYLGSVILLIFNLSMVMRPDWYGIQGSSSEKPLVAMRYSFVTVGVWWLLFSHYSFYFLPKGNKNIKEVKNIVFNGFKELLSVWNIVKKHLNIRRFLGAFFVYSMALQTVMIIAAYFGEQELYWTSDTEKTTGLILSILLIQLIAILGAELTARASGRFGNIPVLIGLNIIWAGICIGAYLVYYPIHFYFIAGCVGLVVGGIQSLSRSTYSKLLPKTKDTTSFFSFYDVSEKVAIIMGITIFGFLDQTTGSIRTSITFFPVLFLIGVVLLLRIPKDTFQ
ncbi:MAG: MFS transporter [Flavobacteriaceae bacterium]|nr:MFS transporter [Flavobacteriaceae bacterium]